jgi:hypothetical protein
MFQTLQFPDLFKYQIRYTYIMYFYYKDCDFLQIIRFHFNFSTSTFISRSSKRLLLSISVATSYLVNPTAKDGLDKCSLVMYPRFKSNSAQLLINICNGFYPTSVYARVKILFHNFTWITNSIYIPIYIPIGYTMVCILR